MLHEMAPRSAPPEPPPDTAGLVRRHVVVDGSNIATEGREAPSLAQLDEAVQAFMREYGPEIVTVVVDATFPNRIARSERKVYEAAVSAGEIITPPAGAIGRGDAFILQIADRADATILSNDSFQEFHGLYEWLFDPGRLVGGKPVPHVGWVFMDRTPVRGPLSRRAVGAAKKLSAAAAPARAAAPAAKASARKTAASVAAREPAAAKKAATPAKAAKPAKAGRPAKATQPAKVTQPAKAAQPAKATQPVKATKPAPVVVTAPANEALPFIEFVGAHPVGSQVQAVVEQFSSHGAYVRVGAVQGYVPLKYLDNPAPRSAKKVLRLTETRTFVVVSVDPARRGIDLALPGVDLTSADAPPPADPPAAEPAPKKARASRSTKKKPAAAKPAKKTPSKKAAAGRGTSAT